MKKYIKPEFEEIKYTNDCLSASTPSATSGVDNIDVNDPKWNDDLI